MLGLSALSFTALWPLLGLAAIPILVLSYRTRIKRNSYIVSSLLYFKTLEKKPVPRDEIRLPFRFFVELLALLFIVLAATLPLIDSTESHAVIILDNSLSMSAIELDGRSRFAHAVEKTSAWLSQDNTHDVYTLLATTPTLLEQGASKTSAAAISRALENITVVAAEDELPAAISRVQELYPRAHFVLVSDQRIEIPLSEATKVSSILVGTPQPNAFIRRVALQQEVGSRGENRNAISGQIQLSGAQPLTVQLSLFGSRVGENALAELPLLKKSITLTPDEPTPVKFLLPAELGGINSFRLALDAKTADATALDNQAWIHLESTLRSQLLLVSPDANTTALGLEKLPGITIETMSPATFSKTDSRDLLSYRALIFHKSAPETALRLPTMLIVPPARNQILPAVESNETTTITSWAEHHPLLSYLQAQFITPSRAVIFSPQSWLSPVLNSSAGAIAVTGESEGLRFIGIGFEILPFEGKKTPALSVFTLNAMQWLLGGSSEFQGALVGDVIEGRVGTAKTPDGTVVTLSTDKPLSTELPGIYLIESEQQSFPFVVNSFFPAESTTTIQQTISWPSATSSSLKATNSNAPIWPWLAVVALLLVMAEWLLRQRENSLSERVVG